MVLLLAGPGGLVGLHGDHMVQTEDCDPGTDSGTRVLQYCPPQTPKYLYTLALGLVI